MLFTFSYSSARPPECCKMFQAGVYEEEMTNREARIRCVNASEGGELYGSEDDDDLVDRFDVAAWEQQADVTTQLKATARQTNAEATLADSNNAKANNYTNNFGNNNGNTQCNSRATRVTLAATPT